MVAKKKNRYFTIMIIPHSDGATFSFQLPLHAVQAFALFTVCWVLAFCILGLACMKLVGETEETGNLRQIKQNQQEEIETLAVEATQAIEHIHDLDRAINKIEEKVDHVVPPVDNKKEQDNTDTSLNHLEVNTTAASNSELVNTISNSVFENHSFSNNLLNRTAEKIIVLQSIVPEKYNTLNRFELHLETMKEKQELAEKKQILEDRTPALWPFNGRVTSGYGMREIPYREGYQFHNGIDIAGSYGSPIRAASDGKVTFSGRRGSLGNLLIIDHANGYETYYAHLHCFAVQTGDKVEKGEKIGCMGRSGRTTGTHLHYEVRFEGSTVNPRPYMKEK